MNQNCLLCIDVPNALYVMRCFFLLFFPVSTRKRLNKRPWSFIEQSLSREHYPLTHQSPEGFYLLLQS